MKYSLATNNAVRYLCCVSTSFQKNGNLSTRAITTHSLLHLLAGSFLALLCHATHGVSQLKCAIHTGNRIMYSHTKWSHQLYMIPLPYLLTPYPCYKMPMQHVCQALSWVQKNSFDGTRRHANNHRIHRQNRHRDFCLSMTKITSAPHHQYVRNRKS